MTPTAAASDLCRQIRQTEVPADGLAFWWLGQQTWILKTATATIGIDLYLSPSPRRLVPPLFAPEEADFFDLFLCSHDHSDHLDRPMLRALSTASPRARILVPKVTADDVRELVAEPAAVVAMNGANACRHGGVHVVSIPAAHELLDITPDRGSRYLGFLIYVDGFCVYHSGDSCVYEGLLPRLQQHRVDIAMVPINGRDAERLRRNCIGNMTYQEAVDLVGLLKPRLACPAHFGMFAGNTCDPRLFAEYLEVKFAGQRYWIPTPGTRVLFRRDGTFTAGA